MSACRPHRLFAVPSLLVLSMVLAAVAAACSASGGNRTAAPASPDGPITIEHGPRDNAQILMTLPSGRRIYIDMFWTIDTPAPTADDVLVTTYDGRGNPGDIHTDAELIRNFPGRKLHLETGTIELPDVRIESIAARHCDSEADGSNHVVVIETAGLRIVHFGDFGQTAFTPEQLARIGTPDIAFSQLWNTDRVCPMTEEEPRGIGHMRQVRPLLFVPTHASMETLAQGVQAWPSFYHKGPLVISKADLPGQTTMLVLNADADLYGASLGIPARF